MNTFDEPLNPVEPEMSEEDRAMFENAMDKDEEPDDQSFEDEHIKTGAGYPSEEEEQEEAEHNPEE